MQNESYSVMETYLEALDIRQHIVWLDSMQGSSKMPLYSLDKDL